MKIARTLCAVALCGMALVALQGTALAHEDHHKGHAAAKKAPEQEVEGKPAQVKLLDITLADQDGKKVRLKTDVIGDRVVVVDFIYTTCTFVCPILSAILSQLQEPLKERLGKDVALVSISVDPTTDIPPRLKEYAARYEARPGWIFLTGAKPDVDEILRGMGAYTADSTQHPTMVLVGEGQKGGWTRFYGFPSPEQLLEKVNELSAARRPNLPQATQ